MRRKQLEHVIRAASAITGAKELVVIGSQAILGQFPDAPQDLTESIEADLFTWRDPRDSDLIDGSIGEGSPFHQTFGYHAHGVGAQTATLPDGWKSRTVQVSTPETGGATAYCLEVHDLAVSKLVAGRDKDLSFVGALIRHSLIDVGVVRKRLTETQLSEPVRALCMGRISRLSKKP